MGLRDIYYYVVFEGKEWLVVPFIFMCLCILECLNYAIMLFENKSALWFCTYERAKMAEMATEMTKSP
jgi:hypothetical protein